MFDELAALVSRYLDGEISLVELNNEALSRFMGDPDDAVDSLAASIVTIFAEVRDGALTEEGARQDIASDLEDLRRAAA